MYGTVQVQECQTADDVRIRARENAEWRRQWLKPPPKPTIIHTLEKVVNIVEIIPEGLPVKTTTLEMLVQEAERIAYFGMPFQKSPSIKNIQKLTCRTFGVHLLDLLSDRRTKNLTVPRHISFVLAKALTPLSLPAIGRATGDRDHTTVLHGIRKYQWLLDQLRFELSWKNSVPEWVFRAHEIVIAKGIG